MLVIGHRGASAAYADNTVEAFAEAVAQGADGVELDVRRTSDQRLALSHDDALADGRVVVETAFADLPADVTDLGTALDVCAPLSVVNIEIKNWPDDKDFDPTEQLAASVVALLEERGELEDGRNLVSCFHLPTIDRVRELAPSTPHGLAARADRRPARPDREGRRRRSRRGAPPPCVRHRGLRHDRARRRPGRQHLDLRRTRSHPMAGAIGGRCSHHQRPSHRAPGAWTLTAPSSS